jgi:Protein of unknown function (DUF2892).
MKQNVGSIDRLVRVVIAIALVVTAWLVGFSGVAGIVLLVLAVVMAVTAAVGFCPLYLPFGLSTRKRGDA